LSKTQATFRHQADLILLGAENKKVIIMNIKSWIAFIVFLSFASVVANAYTTSTFGNGVFKGLLNSSGTFTGDINWTNLDEYPAPCNAGYYVSGIDDSTTCTDSGMVGGTWTDSQSAGNHSLNDVSEFNKVLWVQAGNATDFQAKVDSCSRDCTIKLEPGSQTDITDRIYLLDKVHITLDGNGANLNYIGGLKASSNARTIIFIENSSHITVKNFNFTDNGFCHGGVFDYRSNYSTIKDNNFKDLREAGGNIFLLMSRHADVTQNEIYVSNNNDTHGTQRAIYLDSAYYSSAIDNDIEFVNRSGSPRGFELDGYSGENLDGQYNTVSENTIVNARFGIHVEEQLQPIVSDNNILEADWGIVVANANFGALIDGNNIETSNEAVHYGIYFQCNSLDYSKNGHIQENNIVSNNIIIQAYTGIYMLNSSNDLVIGNSVYNATTSYYLTAYTNNISLVGNKDFNVGTRSLLITSNYEVHLDGNDFDGSIEITGSPTFRDTTIYGDLNLRENKLENLGSVDKVKINDSGSDTPLQAIGNSDDIGALSPFITIQDMDTNSGSHTATLQWLDNNGVVLGQIFAGSGSNNGIHFLNASGDYQFTIKPNGATGTNDNTPDYQYEITGSIADGFFGITNTSNGDILEVGTDGNLNLKNRPPQNLGAPSTDFTATGGLNLADNLTIGTGSAQVNITLTSPDASEWCCGVNDDGSLGCRSGAC